MNKFFTFGICVFVALSILGGLIATQADFSGVTYKYYTTHTYYQIEAGGEWLWLDSYDTKLPDEAHGDIDYYIDYLGYTYGDWQMVRLCGKPIYVTSGHTH